MGAAEAHWDTETLRVADADIGSEGAGSRMTVRAMRSAATTQSAPVACTREKKSV